MLDISILPIPLPFGPKILFLVSTILNVSKKKIEYVRIDLRLLFFVYLFDLKKKRI